MSGRVRPRSVARVGSAPLLHAPALLVDLLTISGDVDLSWGHIARGRSHYVLAGSFQEPVLVHMTCLLTASRSIWQRVDMASVFRGLVVLHQRTRWRRPWFSDTPQCKNPVDRPMGRLELRARRTGAV